MGAAQQSFMIKCKRHIWERSKLSISGAPQQHEKVASHTPMWLPQMPVYVGVLGFLGALVHEVPEDAWAWLMDGSTYLMADGVSWTTTAGQPQRKQFQTAWAREFGSMGRVAGCGTCPC